MMVPKKILNKVACFGALAATFLAATSSASAAQFNVNKGYFLDPTNGMAYQRPMGQATYPVPINIAGQQVYITQGGSNQTYDVNWVMGFIYDFNPIPLDQTASTLVTTDIGGQWAHFNSAGPGAVGTGAGGHSAATYATLNENGTGNGMSDFSAFIFFTVL